MGPEILIVGDRIQRGSLLPRVQDLGYLVTPVRERELTARVGANPAPVAVLICLGDEDPANLIDAVRSGRDDVPVVLYGSLGGAVHDLADVLELGADHFLAEPVGDEELASVLAEVAGPGEDPAADAEERENVLPSTLHGPSGLITPQGQPGSSPEEGDPVLGQLHRTLEILAARLHSESPAEPERDGIDLAALGLDAVPDVDAAGAEGELDPDRGRRETSDPAAPRRSDSTLRLTREVSGPRRGAPARIPVVRPREAVGEGVVAGSTQRLGRGGEAVREDRSVGELGAGSTQRLGREAVREDRSVGEGVVAGSTQRLARGGEAVREDRSGRAGEAVREDRSSGEVTARIVGRRDVSAQGDVQRRVGFDVQRSERQVEVSRGERQVDGARSERQAGPGERQVEVPRSERQVGFDGVRSERRVDGSRGGERLVGLDVVTRLARLHRQRSGGRLVVGFVGGVIKEVWWRAGEPVFATSTAAADGLLTRLLARGMISRGDVVQARQRVDGDLAASVRRLVQAGLLKPREQVEAVRDVVESIVLSLCSEQAERWSLDQAAAPTTVALGVSVSSLLVRGVRLGFAGSRLREGLAGTTCLKVQEQETRGLAERIGEPEAEGWLGLLDGSRSLDDLVAEDGLDERSLWAVACVLVALGLAEESDESASLVEIDRRRVSERLALAHASDYFTLLGVARTAGRAEVVRAHADLRATFAPERLEPASRVAIAEQLAELQAALDEARDVLLDEALRTAYLARLTEEEEG